MQKVCESCRSRQERSNEYLVIFSSYYVVCTCKNRLRYSRERASQRLKVVQFIFSIHSLGRLRGPLRPAPPVCAPPAAPHRRGRPQSRNLDVEEDAPNLCTRRSQSGNHDKRLLEASPGQETVPQRKDTQTASTPRRL